MRIVLPQNMGTRNIKYSDVKKSFIIANKNDIKGELIRICKYCFMTIISLLLFMFFAEDRNGSIFEHSVEVISSNIIWILIVSAIFTLIITSSLFLHIKAPVGIHEKGIWIHRGVDNAYIGFIEWGLIKNIQISQKYEIVYISFYDFPILSECVNCIVENEFTDIFMIE